MYADDTVASDKIEKIESVLNLEFENIFMAFIDGSELILNLKKD